MNKTFLAVAALATLISTTAAAAPNPTYDFRRTLFLSFGQKNLVLEAPQSMCFLDESDPTQEALIDGARILARRQGKGEAMAVFTDCIAVANISQNTTLMSLGQVGGVMWMNPAVGETTDLARGDYLDMREASIVQEVLSSLTSFASASVDEKAQRSDAGVSAGYVAHTVVDYRKYTITGINSATLLEGVPVDFTLTRFSDKGKAYKEEMQGLMDTFVKQQVALNEKK